MKNFIFALLILFSFPVFGQISATTESGKRVILQDDFTWEYAEENETATISLECSDLVKIDHDKMTGESSKQIKDNIVLSKDNKSGLGIVLLMSQNTLIWVTSAVGAGACIADDQKANILFRDGSRLEIENMGKFNCKGVFTYYMGGQFARKKELSQFQDKEISTLRVWTSDGYVEEDFSNDQSAKFKAVVNCLTGN